MGHISADQSAVLCGVSKRVDTIEFGKAACYQVTRLLCDTGCPNRSLRISGNGRRFTVQGAGLDPAAFLVPEQKSRGSGQQLLVRI